MTVHDLSFDGGVAVETYNGKPNEAKYGFYIKFVDFCWLKDVGVRRFAGSGCKLPARFVFLLVSRLLVF